jgi:hypothetical protein
MTRVDSAHDRFRFDLRPFRMTWQSCANNRWHRSTDQVLALVESDRKLNPDWSVSTVDLLSLTMDRWSVFPSYPKLKIWRGRRIKWRYRVMPIGTNGKSGARFSVMSGFETVGLIQCFSECGSNYWESPQKLSLSSKKGQQFLKIWASQSRVSANRSTSPRSRCPLKIPTWSWVFLNQDPRLVTVWITWRSIDWEASCCSGNRRWQLIALLLEFISLNLRTKGTMGSHPCDETFLTFRLARGEWQIAQWITGKSDCREQLLQNSGFNWR